MSGYRLSKTAAADFESIFTYGIDVFGVDQAIKYQTALKQRIESLSHSPLQCPQADHIAPGYRRCVFGAHSIYYRLESNVVLIVRILGQQNPDTSL